MNIVTTFKEKMKDKQLKSERNALRELSVPKIKEDISHFLHENFFINYEMVSAVEKHFVELAVESYLVGIRYSKFEYYGETCNQVEDRCASEMKQLARHLYYYLYSKIEFGETLHHKKKMYKTCHLFVYQWWKTGLEKGKRRYQLRLR